MSVHDAGSASAASLWEPPEFDENGNEPEQRRLPTAAEIEAIEEEARQNGFERGYAEGHELGKQEAEKAARAREEKKLREAVAALESVGQGLSDPLADAADSLEPELLALVTALARQVIRVELQTRPEIIREVLDEAMRQLPGRNRSVRVHLHPEDQALVEQWGSAQAGEITWIPDPELARGGCRVEAGASEVDASLERRLRQAVEAIWDGHANVPDTDPEPREPVATPAHDRAAPEKREEPGDDASAPDEEDPA
ncbi:FliH/SctL family protein [Thioalkalivibrio sp. ALR17-21]|uniref:FliH/SctL family protein n=1 Tax=Thioalkalivibrio sp. ALR17-21 TaxID=1269813 RepID=UPI000402842C|nr:FliH/SctL family protein [Thioalkalivibrio sp. ALR17-21]